MILKPNLIQSQLHKMFWFWNSSIQCSTPDVLTLTTNDIFYGQVVQRMADYFELDPVPGLEQLHSSYKTQVWKKYLKNASSAL